VVLPVLAAWAIGVMPGQAQAVTVDSPAEMERLLTLGIGALRGDGIITNYPDRLIQLLRAKGLRP